MPALTMEILGIVLLLVAIACLLYWGMVAWYLWFMRRTLPTARDGIELAERNVPTAHVCIVVPAHNEAGNIAALIESLRAQDYDRLRIVLALDRCTDDTAGVAREAIGDDHRFEVFEIDHCPDDWAGKVHAAHTGFTRSSHAGSSDMVIFTDADTWFDPSCVRASVALAEDRGLDLLSLLSTLTTENWYEQVVQSCAAFELARQYPLTRVNRTDHGSQRAFANGQFMLFRTQSYRDIGGHEAVKDAILEDIAFARKIYFAKKQGGLLLADNMLRCSMYDSWDAFVRGWKRIYTESANREVRRLKKYALRAPLTGAALPIGSLVCAGFGLGFGDPQAKLINGGVGAIGFLAWLLAVMLLAKVSRARLRDAVLTIVGSVLVGRIFWAAAKDLRTGKPTEWGGKAYTRVSAEEELAAKDSSTKAGAA